MHKYDTIRNHKYFKRLKYTWCHMKQRCYNPNCSNYKWYGAKGIKVCDIWLGDYGFLNFFYWSIASGFSEELSIDRIDVSGDYSPWNCKWSTHKEQQRNKNNSHFIEYKGETKCLGEWAELYGIDYDFLCSRISAGWSLEEAINVEKHQHHKKYVPLSSC